MRFFFFFSLSFGGKSSLARSLFRRLDPRFVFLFLSFTRRVAFARCARLTRGTRARRGGFVGRVVVGVVVLRYVYIFVYQREEKEIGCRCVSFVGRTNERKTREKRERSSHETDRKRRKRRR